MDAQEAATAARTQSVFRLGNERLAPINDVFSDVLALGEWVCECANIQCSERVELTTPEYESVRANGKRFAIAPGVGHLFELVEEVVERTDRFWVVEKTGKAGELADLVDPRGTGPTTRTPVSTG